jgi:fatty-acyl-CoA synthase
VTLTKSSLDAVELLDAVVAREVKGLCIAGEAFIRPILRELEDDPLRWDLSRLRVVFSSGAMLSQQSKDRLIRIAPQAMVVDGLGTSESGTLARSITTADEAGPPATFRLSANTRVIDEDGADVAPGSGKPERLAISGFLPLGYFRDPEKTAATFVELDGRRYVVAGDWAKVAEDGSITLLGRGSSCINIGGEKVYPEEVEEVLKVAAGVHDAGVVGLPDERFGEAVTALVQLVPGALVDERGLIDHVKAHLAGYKAPKRVVIVEALPRGPNGKLDQKVLRQQAADAVNAEDGSRRARINGSRN